MKERKPRGRPKTGVVGSTIYIRPKLWLKAKRIGKGNKSRGVRIALDKFEEEQ